MEAVLNTHLRKIAFVRDLPELLAIEKASFHQPWSAFKFIQFMAQANHSGRIVEVDGEVVGFLMYEKHPERLHVAHVAVKPEYRGNGIGRQMIRSLGDHARSYVTLNVRKSNTEAQRLYHNLGFEVVRSLEHHYADGEDAFLMGYRGL